MGVMSYLYSDSGLVTSIDDAAGLTLSAITGNSVDGVFYVGLPNAAAMIETQSNPGVDQIAISIAYGVSLWQASTVYAVNDYARTTTKNGYKYQVTSGSGAMTSGATEPTWPTTIGNTVVDGDLTWTCTARIAEDTELQLALSSAGLDSAVAGDPLNLGTTISGGSAYAVPVYWRWTNAAGDGDFTDLSFGVPPLQQTAI